MMHVGASLGSPLFCAKKAARLGESLAAEMIFLETGRLRFAEELANEGVVGNALDGGSLLLG